MKETDESQSSSSLTMNPSTVLVRCQFADNKSETIQVSVTDTVAELTAKIAALRKSQTMAEFLLWSGGITIDDKQPDKRLADFGIKPGSTINAQVTDLASTNTSIKTREIGKTYTTTYSLDLDTKSKGLDNLGNTCFMNSALQCLVHVVPLTEFFMKSFTQTHSTDDYVNKSNIFDAYGEVTGAYTELLWNLLKSDRKSYSYYDYSFRPTRMKETIGRLEPRFATFDQQDAQEFMAFLLNTIHQEIKKKNNHVRNTIIKELFFSEIQSSITCSRCQHVSTTVNPISILPLPLNPQQQTFQVNFVKLKGQHECDILPMSTSNRIEHLVQAFFERRYDSKSFNYVTAMTTNPEAVVEFDTPLSKLPEPVVTLIEQDYHNSRIAPFRYENKPTTLKLDECLQGFVSVEVLDDPWFCEQDKCKRDTKARKQLRLLTFPRVLIIQLKRFSHENGLRRKLDTFVDYPVDGFDLGKLLKSSEEAVYDLIAVCNHIGSIYGGHYTAYARKFPKTEKWYKFDDSYVSTIYYKEEIVSRDAYLLFYLKRQKQTQSLKSTMV
ncbi:unnamed protein product [Rotaria sp. Silwood1]|nr:unnamed protein product [Rotaria sp. Silwood1]CAF1264379.1 unnamed protein product [Rotaria sp. Silwood1]CAF3498017.1 unnamed protein product [Rotaria sp. Silwood1]CAF4765234.1 unnamed protein product [Rotaria sp. Silwood1]